MKIPRYKCKRCYYEWNGRSENKPRMCPRCKSYYWEEEKGGKKLKNGKI